MVQVAGLRKAFGEVTVLDDVDLEAAEGTVLALLGPNGAGKTTMVRILSTLERPDGGRAVVAGHDVVREPAGVRRAISVTGQETAVDDLLTGAENLRLVGRLRRLDRATARRRADELLELVDLTDAADRLARTYSGGMRRRLDIALGLVTRPPVIFLDEPTTGLDPRSRHATWATVRRLVADGTAVLLTTQYLEEADQLADEIAVLAGGRIATRGTPAELKRRVDVERIELVLPDQTAYDRAHRVLGGDGVVADPAAWMVTVPSDGSATAVHQVLDRLGEAGVPVDRIAINRPTLDDVFFAITGQERS